MAGIAAMLNELVQTYKPIPGAEVLFPSRREVVGKCPRCGAEVTESQKGFFCENRDCSFVLWKNSRFFAAKKKTLTLQQRKRNPNCKRRWMRQAN